MWPLRVTAECGPGCVIFGSKHVVFDEHFQMWQRFRFVLNCSVRPRNPQRKLRCAGSGARGPLPLGSKGATTGPGRECN